MAITINRQVSFFIMQYYIRSVY